MSLIDRAFETLNDFQFRVMKRRAAFTQPAAKSVLNFSQPKPEHKIPTFGSDTSGFGQEYGADAPSRPFTGPLPLQEHENTHGFVNPNSERPIPEEAPYQDPAISPRASRTSEGTDQKIVSGIHEADYDKPIVLHNEPHKSFQSSKPKGDPTEGDRAEKDQKNWDFDFSV